MLRELDRPLVSVVCLAFNQEKFIGQAIDSFLQQRTNFPFEIIIHDDASTDATSSIIASYAKRYPDLIVAIFQSENQYSKGIRMPALAFSAARGEFIAYCEGDDFWVDPCKLQKQADLLNSRAEVGVVFTDKNVWIADSNTVLCRYDYSTSKIIPVGDVRHILLLSNPYSTCTSMFRSDLVRGYELIAAKVSARMDDYIMWLHIAGSAHVAYLPESTATYRVLRESASHSRSLRKNLKFLRSYYRTAMHFNREYGSIIPNAVIADKYRQDELACLMQLQKWRASWTRRKSTFEFGRLFLQLWIKRAIARYHTAYVLFCLYRRAFCVKPVA